MKNIRLTDILFYFTFSVVVIITVFFDKKYLAYALPIMIVSIGVIYFERILKINFWYVLSLVSMIICDTLIYTDFVQNFATICILTSIYFISCTLALRKYLLVKNINRNTFLSVPILVSSGLVVYLIYAIAQLLIDVVKEALPEVVVCLIGSTLYLILSYLIYVQDISKEGLKLIVVAFLCIFIVSLLPINELFYSSRIFTVFINIAHVLSIYLLMKYLIRTTPEKEIPPNENYL
ncbi:hypothetical protein [uncultured Aquimarina sp.]|uniref:hypothetical protein n=1 Tax=uncultured Aquimarina sp. TaxID=575652 RepID=UPI0026085917|nr:hypothetical protein [uncultured Aquimarina sp.]